MIIENRTFDEERALYGQRELTVRNCVFSGPADGESPLKECRNITVERSRFDLRYPFWHVDGGLLKELTLTESCRAALWYDNALTLERCTLNGIKALRECDRIMIKDCSAISGEFGWKCRDLKAENLTLTSEYPFMDCRRLELDGLKMTGKYSFQYTQDSVIRNSVLKTKDAFWHTKNVTVIDSVVEGEYLAWYSENLHLIRCKIIGTQPLCYCKGLVLEDCTMEKTDLSFENSEVTASVAGHIDSVKNPRSGVIRAGSIGELILDGPTEAEIITG